MMAETTSRDLCQDGDKDTSMLDPRTPSNIATTSTQSNKRKAKDQESYSRGHEITSITIRAPPFAYAHLEVITSPHSSTLSQDLDALTVRSYLTAALKQFLGLAGEAISVDILKVAGKECWVRVPRQDMSPFLAAVGGWVGDGVGWRVRAKGNWLSSLVMRMGEENVWR